MTKQNKDYMSALRELESRHGKSVVMDMDAKPSSVESISSGSLALDVALGIGGFPKGRIIEIFGEDGSGRTTIGLELIAQCQKLGGTCVYVDVDHALSMDYVRSLGIDMQSFKLAQPDCAEQALDVVDVFGRSNAVDLIVVDTVSALVSKAELEDVIGSDHKADQARIMSQALRKITANINRTGCIVVFINQIRSSLEGALGGFATSGGMALKFYSSMRLEVTKVNKGLAAEVDHSSLPINIRVVKNKLAPPFKTAACEIRHGVGYDLISELVPLAVACGVITTKNTAYFHDGKRIGTGSKSVQNLLKDDPVFADRITKEILAVYGVSKPELPVGDIASSVVQAS